MPRKGYIKHGSQKDIKEQRARQYKTVKALDDTYDFILKQMKDTKTPPTDQQLRFISHYSENRADAIQREEAIDKKGVGLPEGKLKEYVERLAKLIDILKAANIHSEGRIDHFGELVLLKEFGYYQCDFCSYIHKEEEKCPFVLTAETLKLDLGKEHTDREIDDLMK